MHEPARVVVIDGDGIGPELVEAALAVLDAAVKTFALNIDIARVPGGAEE